jgi:acetolactate synthase I/II/III large subunit
MNMTGAEILIESLIRHGVDTLFGYPGGAVLFIYDAIYQAKGRIQHILTSHEQGAAHAADGYARATGKVGVCLATSGPGATNLVTGIATAYMDSIPMVAITGQVPTSLLGKDSFQEVDITGITMPITKHNFIVKEVSELEKTIQKAFYIAKEGRPGPVLVDVCKDVTAQSTTYQNLAPKEVDMVYKEISKEQIDSVVEIIEASQRPMVLSGGGVSIAGANEEVLAFCNKAQSPISTTLMGLGSFPGTHPLFTGLMGMHGSKTSNLAVSGCDLFIAIGARFSDRVISNVRKFALDAKIVHIDVDPAEIGKNVFVHYPLVGDIKAIIKRITDQMEPKQNEAWISQIREWKQNFPLRYAKDGTLKPHYVMERLYALTKGEALITTEVGQNQIWAAQFYKYTSPRQFISSGGLGTMGYGLGASIGAQLGRPEKKVINVAGDGSFRMNCNEIATAVEYKLPIVLAILNNHALGMVRQWQHHFYDSRFSATTLDRGTDFVALAEAYGAIGIRVTTREEVDAAFIKALSSKDVPVVINFEIDRDDKVFPLVPPGAAISELIDEIEG